MLAELTNVVGAVLNNVILVIVLVVLLLFGLVPWLVGKLWRVVGVDGEGDSGLGVSVEVLDRPYRFFLAVGYVLTLAGLLLLFNWSFRSQDSAQLVGTLVVPEDIEIEPPPTRQEQPKPPPPQIQVQKIIETEEKVEDTVQIQETEITEETKIEAPPPPPPEPEIKEEKIFEVVEEQAEFPGGQDALYEYMRRNYRYPEYCKELGLEGMVVVRFVVEKDGRVTNVQVMHSTVDCPPADSEAVRVVRSMPRWKPARVQGRPVRSWFMLPFTLRLD